MERMSKSFLRAAVVPLFVPLYLAGASLNFTIGTQFAGLSFFQGAGWVPPDMGLAVGSNEMVQMVNGGYEIFNKLGTSLTGAKSDISLWTGAGVSPSLVSGSNILSDPRAVYDPVSGRFIVAQINVDSSSPSPVNNTALIGISKTSDPFAGGWKAVTFAAATASTFADFPMLGFDQNGVYLGSNNFDSSGNFTGTSLFSIPKSNLLAASPTLANLTSFLNSGAMGFTPQAAWDPFGSHGEVLGLGNPGTVDLFNVNGSGGAGATLSSVTSLSGITDGSAICPTQSDNSQITCNIDNRYSQRPVIVGNLMYAVNSFGQGSVDVIHWMIIDIASQLVLQQGTITDPSFDYTYPSVAANSNGDFLIGFNRSGSVAGGNMQAWAVHCHYDGTTGACGKPGQLGTGDGSINGDGRWGDYSAIQIDPDNPDIFWTSLEVPLSGHWGTQITELIIPDSSVPEPATVGLLTAGLSLFAYIRRKRA
jgi:hypothetical protein